MKWFRNVVEYISGAQGRKEREKLEMGMRKHLDGGKASYHSSWMSSGFGLESFQQALTLQDKLYGKGDHPEKIETLVWIAKSLQKQNELEESMSALKSAFRMQLQSGALYQSATAGILDCMVNVLSAMGTPHASKQAQIVSNTLFRIKYRLFGKGFDFVDSDPSFSILDTDGIKQSLFEEEHGDHLFHESKENALAKYKEAALLEYKEFGSHNLNFALLHRKIALSGMSTPKDFPFQAHVTPQCQTEACKIIRKGDDLLFQTQYERATSFYLRAASNKRSPNNQVIFAISLFIVLSLLFFAFLIIPGFERRIMEWLLRKKSQKNKTTAATCSGPKSRDVKIEPYLEHQESKDKSETKFETAQAMDENAEEANSSAFGQQILDGETPDADENRENHEIFSGSFESLGALLQQSSIVASATEILASENDS